MSIHRDTSTSGLIVALFTLAKLWSQLICPLIWLPAQDQASLQSSLDRGGVHRPYPSRGAICSWWLLGEEASIPPDARECRCPFCSEWSCDMSNSNQN